MKNENRKIFEKELRDKIPILLALSTCPRCTRVKRFLDEYKIKATIVDVDQLSFSEKRTIYKFMQPYNPRLSFPTLIYGKKVAIGEEIAVLKEVFDLK